MAVFVLWGMHSRYLKSIQKDVFLVRWVGSIMSWCNPEWEALSSISESSFAVLSFSYQSFDFTWRSPRTTVKALFTENALKLGSSFFVNISASSWDWLGQRYKATKLHNLSLIFISKLMHSCKV